MSRGGGFNPLDALFGAASQAANVGAAVASAAATAAANSAVSAANAAASVSTKVLSSEAQFFDETVTPERIKHLLDNVELGSGKASMQEKTEGMKYIMASMARGRDVSEFYPDVVRNVIHKDVALKKLVYSYLVANADYNANCREMALLTINSFQRDLSDANQLIRSMALRVLTSIRVREIVQIQLMSLKKCASDNSPYVRKTAAHACGKIFQIDPEAKGELCETIERLLGDKNTQVLSSAVAAFAEVAPDSLELLHPHFRKLCALLADLDDWGQITALGVLTRYARVNFTKPKPTTPDAPAAAAAADKKKKDFYEEEEDEEGDDDEDEDEEEDEEDPAEKVDPDALPEDHALLLRVALPLLRSRNSGVVLAVAALYHYVGQGDLVVLARVGRALVRTMRAHREVQYIVLTNILTFARESPDMLRKFLKDFFIAETEPLFVRRMKIEVLAALAAPDNVAAVLREFTRYVKDDDKDFVRHAIQAIVRIANAIPDVADKCLRGLMGLVSTDTDAVVAEAVVAIRQLLQQHPEHDALIVRLARKMDKISMPSARAAIVWILGEFQAKPRVAAMAPDALRVLAKSFRSESPEVKAQIVNLAAKTALCQPESAPVQLLLRYVLELARYDSDYDLRDRARLLRTLLLGSEGLTALAADAAEEAGAFIAVVKAGDAVADVSAAEKAEAAALAAAGGEPAAAADGAAVGGEGEGGAAAVAAAPSSPGAAPAPAAVVAPVVELADRVRAVLLAAKPPPIIESAYEASGSAAFAVGSLSFMVGHTAKGFLPVPGWAETQSSPSLREPPADDDAPKRKAAADDDDDDDEDSEEDEDEEEEEEDEEEEEEDDEDDDDEDEAPPARRGRQPAGRAAPARPVAGEDDEDEDESEEESD